MPTNATAPSTTTTSTTATSTTATSSSITGTVSDANALFSETLFLLSEGPIRAPAISDKSIIQKVTKLIFDSFGVTHRKERTKICWNQIYTLPTVDEVKEALKTLCHRVPPANKKCFFGALIFIQR